MAGSRSASPVYSVQSMADPVLGVGIGQIILHGSAKYHLTHVVPRMETILVAYIRRKKVDGNWYFYLVEGTRVNGKVRQRVVAYLGKYATVGAAYLHWVRESRKPERKQYAMQMMKQLEPYIEEN